MIAYVDLHKIRPGSHMFMAAVSYDTDPSDPGFAYDEIDFVADKRLTGEQLVGAAMAQPEYQELYRDAIIWGIIDQSVGEKVYVRDGFK